MPNEGSSGTTLIAYFPGTPVNAAVSAFNVPPGTVVIDYSTPAIWQKTSALGDNSGYSANSGGTLTAPLISGGLTASGSAANNFSGSTGTFLTSTGRTTIGGPIAFKSVNTAVAAAGSTNADAAALTTASMQHVSSDSAAKGVILPTSVAGYQFLIINDSATACEIYPDAGGNVNGQTTTSGSVTIPASKGVIATCTVALTWIIFDLAAKSS